MGSDNKKDNNHKLEKPQPIDRRELAKLLGRLGVGGAAAAALAFRAPQAQAGEPTGGGGCFQACIEDFWREGDGDMSDPDFDWLPLVMRAQSEWMGGDPPARGFTLNFGPRNYGFSGPIELIRSMHIAGSGSSGWYAGTQLQFPANVPGIICRTNWSLVERVRLLGGGGSRDAHGVVMKWRMKLRDVAIQGFGGDGVNRHYRE